MNKHDDGGHAFPQHEPINNEMHPDYGTDRGMTLRDYFAAKAMASHMHALSTATTESAAAWHAMIAKLSYETADAMLKERSK